MPFYGLFSFKVDLFKNKFESLIAHKLKPFRNLQKGFFYGFQFERKYLQGQLAFLTNFRDTISHIRYF